MNKTAIRGLVILLILAALIIALYFLGELESLISWQGASLLVAALLAFAAPFIMANNNANKEKRVKEGSSAFAEKNQDKKEPPSPQKKKQKKAGTPAPQPAPEFALTPEELSAVQEVFRQTELPCVKLTATRGFTDIFDSKFGGTPYLPPGFEYPHNKNIHSEKNPLKLLCQLNFAQLPQLLGFPAEGILQFYIPFEDSEDIYGIDFDHPTRQDSWRVVYHRQIIKERARLQDPPFFADEDAYFPFSGEFALKMEQALMPIIPSDYSWEDFFQNVLESSAIGQVLKDKYNEDDVREALLELDPDSAGHRVGGYPFFTQGDPREYSNYKDHSVLLLQIDSEGEIIWGDVGVATFLITPDALMRSDFSEVHYYWDCM